MTKPDFERIAEELDVPYSNSESIAQALREAYTAGLELAAEIAQSVRAPASIGRDHGRHHEAGAQSAARLIRAEKEKTDD